MLRRLFALGLLGVIPILGGGCPCCSSLADEGKPKMAVLGADTRNPIAEEAKTYGLASLGHCLNGQYVKTVEKGGPAEKAGLEEGDVVVSLDSNKLYSRDDFLDFLRVMKPGTKVEAIVKRAGTFKEEKVTLTLGAGPEVAGKGIAWQHAGLGQLDSALAAAKNDKKLVLVGLSGADT